LVPKVRWQAAIAATAATTTAGKAHDVGSVALAAVREHESGAWPSALAAAAAKSARADEAGPEAASPSGVEAPAATEEKV